MQVVQARISHSFVQLKKAQIHMSGLQMWLHLDLMEVATSIHARLSQHIQRMSKAIKKHGTALHSVLFLMHTVHQNLKKKFFLGNNLLS